MILSVEGNLKCYIPGAVWYIVVGRIQLRRPGNYTVMTKEKTCILTGLT